METVELFKVEDVAIHQIEAIRIDNPIIAGEYIYVIKTEQNTNSYDTSELDLSDSYLFTTSKEAWDYINRNLSKEEAVLKAALDFQELCEKYDERNPFIDIGHSDAAEGNNSVIGRIQDPVLKQFLSWNLYTDERANDPYYLAYKLKQQIEQRK